MSVPQPGALSEETTVQFDITVVLQPGDDPYLLEDHLTNEVCKFFGATKCEEGVDCPRFWVAGNSIVEDATDPPDVGNS